jgi:hypothetical protein
MVSQSDREQYLLLLSAAADLLQCKTRLSLTGLSFPMEALEELQRWVLAECQHRQDSAYREMNPVA